MTHDTMYYSMLPKQYDLSWGTDEPFLFIPPIKLQFLDGKSEGVMVGNSDVFVL